MLVRHRLADRVTHRAGARERDDGQPRVGDQGGCAVVGHQNDRHRSGRQVGLSEDLTEQQRGQRRLRRRLHHDGRPDRHGRRDLVSDQVEREVEGRDAEHRTPREPAYERQASRGCRVGVEALDLSAPAPGLFGGPAERRNATRHLDVCPLPWLARLGGDQGCDLVSVGGQL